MQIAAQSYEDSAEVVSALVAAMHERERPNTPEEDAEKDVIDSVGDKLKPVGATFKRAVLGVLAFARMRRRRHDSESEAANSEAGNDHDVEGGGHVVDAGPESLHAAIERKSTVDEVLDMLAAEPESAVGLLQAEFN